jgi:hypothetical protein
MLPPGICRRGVGDGIYRKRGHRVLWSPTHGFTGVVPFIRDSLPAMPGVRRGRRAPQPVLQMLRTFRMRSMGQLVPACRENPDTRKPIHPRASPGSSGQRDHWNHRNDLIHSPSNCFISSEMTDFSALSISSPSSNRPRILFKL